MSAREAPQPLPHPAGEDAAEVARLAREVERLASSERELKGLLADAHEAIAERDRGLDRLRVERDQLHGEAARAHAHVAEIKRTRVWRTGTTLWRLRDLLLRRP